MSFTRRHLPHWVPAGAVVFVSWRLAGSVRGAAVGPVWLEDPRVARVVADALLLGEATGRYRLLAWVVMPNHVHVIFEPRGEMAIIMRWLKGRTARVANRVLGRTGEKFWQEESFDHWVRSDEELGGLVDYVENNPVKAGLVERREEWLWSSAARLTDDKKRSSVLLHDGR